MSKTINLRDGREIEFTKVNPVTTFKAMRNELKKRGFETYDYCNARTGSKYFSMYNDDDFEIEVRCSNHTDGYKSNGLVVSVSRDDNGISGLVIDLSKCDMCVTDFRRLLSQIDIINNKGLVSGILAAYKSGISVKDFMAGKEISEEISEGLEYYLKDMAKYL